MPIRTCTTFDPEGDVTIGWANVASEALFIQIITQRYLEGCYFLITPLASRLVVYNNATKINKGVTAHELSVASRAWGPALLDSGDVSIMRVEALKIVSGSSWRAKSPRDVLDHDTLEVRTAAPRRGVASWVKSMSERVLGETPFVIDDVVTHPSGRTVQIVGGQYWGDEGYSNHWSWREILADGQLSDRLEHGYGWTTKKL